MRKTVRLWAWMSGAVGIVLLAGCESFVGGYSAPAEVPDALRYVLENAADYSAEPGGVQAPQLPDTGQPVLPEGCWASCIPYSTGVGQQQVCEVLIFDAANQALTRQVYHNILNVLVTIDVMEGVIAPADGGLSTYTVERIASTIHDGTLADASDDYDTLPIYNVRLQVEDGKLVTYFDEPGDPRTVGGFADRVALTHTAMDCP